MSESVSWIVVDELDSGRGQFDEYYDRLDSVVPTPDTEILELSDTGVEKWDTESIKNVMRRNDWDRAFIRTMQKAAPRSIEKGSIIHNQDESEIGKTVRSLLTQTNLSEWKHGGKIAVREILDTRFCLGSKHHMCHPEIRYIIEGGDILCKIPDNVKVDCSMQYDYLEETIQQAEPPTELAERVASEFSDSTWAVDFVMDTSGDWYCLEMNLNGVRWEEESRRWVNICGYGNKLHLSPEVIHGSVLSEIGDDSD